MKRCPRCKEEVAAEDFVLSTGYCKPCNRARVREWARANPKRAKEQAARARVKHREKRRVAALERYHRLMAEDPEKVRAYRRAQAKTEKGIVYNRMARHKRRGVSPDALAREYAAILLRDPCSYCAAPAVELDHIDPVTRAGSGTWENLTAACRMCNAQKNDRPLLVFVAA